MNKNSFFGSCFLVCFCLLLLSSCNRDHVRETSFTKTDSLTETYLALQDTLIQKWNMMMHDDNRKLRAMNHLIHELTISNPEKRDVLDPLGERLEALKSMRYNQQTISKAELVSEYDFASGSLVTEVISLAESQTEFAYNTTLQKLVDSIRAADERVNDHRKEYDRAASEFNRFMERNTAWLRDITQDTGDRQKPLFDMAAE